MNKEIKVNAVVVTYNRRDLLKECLEALLTQTFPLNRIIVVDNCSTDDTREMLKNEYSGKNVEIYRLSQNTGGAGGFYLGIKKALKDSDRIWAMDDDTIPLPDALEELLKAEDVIEEKTSFLASTVYGKSGEAMNVPHISSSKSSSGYSFWYKYLKDGIVEISDATLVSLLFNTDAVMKCGAPHPFFFIWGDDVEYTMRLTKYYGKAYFVGNSRVIHKREGGAALSIKNETNIGRIKMYKNMYRNDLVIAKSYRKFKNRVSRLAVALKTAFACLFGAKKYRFRKFSTVISAVFSYWFGGYNRKAFKNRFDNIKADYLEEYLE